ncbi:hypothetical protein IWW34DRAFT_675121, partial [Fusarium oxysporum f. sp. albedinis]|uniref:Uncharacterized protein n=1 Tax=Fusarium oxysporum (strain Fo5176) TaxID=660025 RepID=F9G1M9_FUSOF
MSGARSVRLDSVFPTNLTNGAQAIIQLARKWRGGTAWAWGNEDEKQALYAFNLVTREDRQAMTTISVMTMVFLPATFASAILSTSFFDYNENGWTVSDKFWIFWVVTIPLTLVAVLYSKTPNHVQRMPQ